MLGRCNQVDVVGAVAGSKPIGEKQSEAPYQRFTETPSEKQFMTDTPSGQPQSHMLSTFVGFYATQRHACGYRDTGRSVTTHLHPLVSGEFS